MEIIKIKVCVSCLSPNVVDVNCICVHENSYETIILEFNKCGCCGNIIGDFLDNEFNNKQLKQIEN